MRNRADASWPVLLRLPGPRRRRALCLVGELRPEEVTRRRLHATQPRGLQRLVRQRLAAGEIGWLSRLPSLLAELEVVRLVVGWLLFVAVLTGGGELVAAGDGERAVVLGLLPARPKAECAIVGCDRLLVLPVHQPGVPRVERPGRA